MNFKLSESDKVAITSAVSKAEKKTSGEIVPIIISKSDDYPAAHSRFGIILAVIVTFAMRIQPYYPVEVDHIFWAFLACFAIGYYCAFNFRIKRFFTGQTERAEEVHQKALEIFFHRNLHTTKDRTGILIMISLLEHRVEVVADAGINEKVEKHTWDNLVKELIRQIKNDKMIDGLTDAISTCGDYLSHHFPIKEDDENELSDEVVTDENLNA